MTRSLSEILKRLCVTTLAIALLTPAVAHAAQTPSGGLIGSPVLGPAIGRLSYSGLISLEIPTAEGLSVGPRFTGEVMYGFMDLAPQLRLDLGGRIGFGIHSGDNDLSAWVLDFVPDAKLRYTVMDQLGIYGDLGMGLGFLHASQGPFSNTDAAFTIQFGAGVAYAITPNINLLGEVRFDFYTKSGSGTFIQIPTVGVEFH